MEEEPDLETLFTDPEGYYPEIQPTFATHCMLSGQTVRVRLVGSHPLYVSLSPPIPVYQGSLYTETDKREICYGTPAAKAPTTSNNTPNTSGTRPCWKSVLPRACPVS